MLAGLGVAVLALLVVTSSAGPVGFVDVDPPGSGAAPTPFEAPTPTVSPATSVPAADASQRPFGDHPPMPPAWLLTLVQSLVVLALVAAGVLVLRWLLQVVPRWRSRTHTGRAVVPPPDLTPDALTESAEHRMTVLLTGAPRNAIVACWIDLEAAAAVVGLARHPAETPTEFTRRVLTTWPVSEEALDGLGTLYREARFSRHALTEGHRDTASMHLSRLHADLAHVGRELATARAAAAEATALAAATAATARAAAGGAAGRQAGVGVPRSTDESELPP